MWKQSDKRISFLLFDFYINFITRRYVKKNKYEKKWNYDFKLCFPDRSGKKKSRSNKKLDRYKTNLLEIQRWKREKNIWRRKYGSLSRNKISKIRSETRSRSKKRGSRFIYSQNTRRSVRAGIVEPACGVSPFSMTKSPPGQAKPGVENRKKKILISLSTVNEQTLPALQLRIVSERRCFHAARNRRTRNNRPME